MTWQDDLRELDEDLAGGRMSVEDYRNRRDQILASAATSPAAPRTGPVAGGPVPRRTSPFGPTGSVRPFSDGGQTPPGGYPQNDYLRPPPPPPPPPSPRRHAAGFHSDTDGGTDQLGIVADVDMLADLVASRLITPPLSIGLFGNWGTGKSFFMRSMQARVRTLADAAAAAELAARRRGREVSSFCSSVRQVTFNAWHYAEANLWASMATHIFDNLASTGSEDELRRRADDLAELRRTEQSLLSQLSAIRLERMLVAAQHERAPVRLGLTPEDYEWIAHETGVEAATTQQVREFAGEVSSTTAEVRRGWRLVRTDFRALCTLGLGAVLVIALAVLVRSPVWPVVAGIAATLAAVIPVLSTVRQASQRIREAATRAGQATEQRLAELDEEVERLERAVGELAPGHDSTAFAESRHASDDYRQHLGIVSLLRRDLETFATILAREGSGGVERVVLYIDDLDRCPAEVVVKVLEAIHLLVALPVFVVVVGVDPRWLRRAIQTHYTGLLTDATPEQYLEKIFQIPFQLPTMSDIAYRGLVRGLTGAEQPSAAGPAPAGAPSATRVTSGSTRSRTDGSDVLELRPQQLEISAPESDFLCCLGPLLSTPRTTKRVVNLYRLIRSRLTTEELATFAGADAEPAKAVLVLLAVHAHDARTAAHLFADLETGTCGTWSELMERQRADAALETICETLAPIDGVPEPLELYREWLPLVRRLSFDH